MSSLESALSSREFTVAVLARWAISPDTLVAYHCKTLERALELRDLLERLRPAELELVAAAPCRERMNSAAPSPHSSVAPEATP